MEIIKIITGNIETNTYIICNGENSVVIDPAVFSKELEDIFNLKKIKPKYVLITHGHFDHINGVRDIKDKYNSVVFSSVEELRLIETELNMAHLAGETFKSFKVDRFVEDNETIDLDGINIKVLKTPGHSIGSVCYIFENSIFCGDTIFHLSVGRTDLPTGSRKQLQESIKEKLFLLRENYVLLPGHGEKTSLEFEKKNNPYV